MTRQGPLSVLAGQGRARAARVRRVRAPPSGRRAVSERSLDAEVLRAVVAKAKRKWEHSKCRRSDPIRCSSLVGRWWPWPWLHRVAGQASPMAPARTIARTPPWTVAKKELTVAVPVRRRARTLVPIIVPTPDWTVARKVSIVVAPVAKSATVAREAVRQMPNRAATSSTELERRPAMQAAAGARVETSRAVTPATIFKTGRAWHSRARRMTCRAARQPTGLARRPAMRAAPGTRVET